MSKEAWITMRQFAKHFKMTRQAVHDRIQRGTIKGKLISGVWFIRKSDLKKYQKVKLGSRSVLLKT